MASYTTFTTGLMVSGVLLLRHAPLGYLLASMMLVFTVTLGTNLLVAGMAQLLSGVIALAQFIGFTASFVILTLLALWLTVVFFGTCSDTAGWQKVYGA